MRPFHSLVGFLIWRVALARTGLRMRLHHVLSILVMLAGIGAAIGYNIVGRFLAPPEDDEAAETRLDAG